MEVGGSASTSAFTVSFDPLTEAGTSRESAQGKKNRKHLQVLIV